MYKKCTTEKSALQQRRMEQALLELLQSKPYGEITVCEICEWAGLSRKVFYRLFSGKDSVLHALVDHTILDYLSFGSEERKQCDELEQFFAYWLHHRKLLDVLHENGKINLLLERELAQAYSERGFVREFFGLQDHPHSSQLVMFYLSGIMSLVVGWYLRGFSESCEEMADILRQLLSNSLTQLREKTGG